MLRLPCLVAILVASSALAGTPPSWWTSAPSTILQTGGTPNNYALANNGQLKFMAWQAKVYLDATLPGGAGTEINNLVAGFQPQAGVSYTAAQLAEIKRINYLPVVFKHLRSVANVFYTRLNAAGYNSRDSLKNFGYPANWAENFPFGPSSPAAADYSPVTIGQLKMVFSFNVGGLSSGDADGDSLPDAWEIAQFGDTGPGNTDDTDGDGLTNAEERTAGLLAANPHSDFDGVGDKQEFTVDGTDPMDANDVTPRRIAYFPMDAANLVSAEGQLPRSSVGVVPQVPGWNGYAVSIDGVGDVLTYDWKRPDGSPNYSFKRGSVRLRFKPSWGSVQTSGTWSRLFEIGGPWSAKAYAIAHFHATKPTVFFGEHDGVGHYNDYESAAHFQMVANTWHQFVITWSPTSRSIYVDGVLLGQTAVNWTWPPKVADIVAAGLTLGNESPGGQPIYGDLDEVEFFNYELSQSEITANLAAEDPDLDGLSNYHESMLGTNPNLFDTDGDGLSDGFEASISGLNPHNYNSPTFDSDGDGMPDVFEIIHGLGITDSSDAGLDPDGDGLTNLQEYLLGYDPAYTDSNHNDVSDSAEDYDEDGLSNFGELSAGTDPQYFDTDGDLLGDGFEVSNGLNPLGSNGAQGATGDGDGDGLDNFDEQMHGTSASTADANADGKSDGRDSDGDGASDGTEVGQGSDPNDPSDGGLPPPPGTIEEVEFAVGDPSGSHSERWELTIKGLTSAIDKRTIHFQSRQFGEMDSKPFKLHKGAKYELSLKHIATDPAYDHTDYDWEAKVGGLPGTPVLQPEDEGKAFVIKSWVIDNRQGPLGNVDESFDKENKSTGKKAYLLPVQINEVSFNGTRYWELKSDDAATTYSAPQWKDIDGNGKPTNTAQGERDYAVAFTRNTKPTIGAKFKITSASNFGAIKIKATGPGGVAIPETAATVSGDDVTLPLTEASSALVNTIKFYDKKDDAKAFKLEWEVKIGNSDWSKIGTTKHTVYVTLDDPKTSLRQESLFEISCRNADGINQTAPVTDAIWNEFTDRVVKRVDGVQLTYYNAYTCNYISTEDLLKFGDGQCGAWAKFFIDLRKVQGIDDTDKYVIFEPLTADGFIVKNWNFLGSGTSGISGFPYLNIPDSNLIGTSSYNWKFAEVTDAQGIPGQGNANPASLFNNHQVVIAGQYHDPSYGVKHASLQSIDDNAIDGFYIGPGLAPVDELAVNLDLNNDGDKTDMGINTVIMAFKKNPSGLDLTERRRNY